MDAYLGEIRLFAGVRCPQDWHFCDGALLDIQTYQVLFALLGTRYGGNGISNFALPDLRGRVPVHQGTGPGLSMRGMGQTGGGTTASVALAQLPMHTHTYQVANTAPTTNVPENAATANYSNTNVLGYLDESKAGTKVNFDPNMLTTTGSGQAHDNTMPSMAMNFIICLVGQFPQRT